MVVTIIPTIGRDTLERAVISVANNRACAIIQQEGTAGENRNKGIKQAKTLKAQWITFLDDDDYYNAGWNLELDSNYDIIVLRMKQGEAIIPDETDELRWSNVGINFALNMNKIKWEDLPEFDSNGEGEDWRFLEKLLQKYNKVKITKDIYYVAEKRNYNQ
jgi:glycosyltransferase involved in cell wall biosynthesis